MSYTKPFLNCLDIYKKPFGVNFIKKNSNTEFCKEADNRLRAGGFTHYPGGEVFFKRETLQFVMHPQTGVIMENVKSAIEEIHEDIEKSIDVLQQSYNELLKTHGLIAPQIIKMSKELREKRLALTTEIKSSISLMRDIRKFFLEKDHKIEIERIEEFLNVCERVKALIEDGTMDTITETILRLEGVKNSG